MLSRRTLLVPTALLAVACGASDPAVIDSSTDGTTTTGAVAGKADSSAEAIFLDFEFDSELLTSSCWNNEGQIEDQMLFTIGQFNGEGGVGRIDRLVLSNVRSESVAGGCKISYHGRMPVAWPKRLTTPSKYTLLLPRDLNSAAQDAFAERYHGCAEAGAHDLSAGNFWYYYRPRQSACKLDDKDIVKAEAAVFPSSIQTTGKYPEYHEVWEDNRLEVVAIFGKYEDTGTASDAGVRGYDEFSQAVKKAAAAKDPSFTVDPPDLAFSPGVAQPSFTVTAKLEGGRVLQVKGFLVNNIQAAPASFWDEYEALTPTADYIVYNGHAGLGSNVRKLAQMGKWVAGQYAIIFQNGCDTYAYISDALAEAHAKVNPDDPEGTKHLDTIANARPSFFSSMPAATMAITNALLDYKNPKTYEQIFRNIDKNEVVLVTGEADNVYTPGYTGEAPVVVDTWKGLDVKGTVAENEEKQFETPALEAGRYSFDLSGSGDADLYLRVGGAPTTSLWECRPYADGSAETCEVSLNAPAKVFVMIRGYAKTSDFQLIGAASSN